jgi:hypothetical protein
MVLLITLIRLKTPWESRVWPLLHICMAALPNQWPPSWPRNSSSNLPCHLTCYIPTNNLKDQTSHPQGGYKGTPSLLSWWPGPKRVFKSNPGLKHPSMGEAISSYSVYPNSSESPGFQDPIIQVLRTGIPLWTLRLQFQTKNQSLPPSHANLWMN